MTSDDKVMVVLFGSLAMSLLIIVLRLVLSSF